MNNATMPPTTGQAITLRPEGPEDEGFLFAVYADSREEEMKLTSWNEAERRVFLEFQFKAQRLGYRGMYPEAAFLIVMDGTERVGRLVVNRASGEIRVVDIALRAACQRRGLGSRLLKELMAEARQARHPLRVSVFNGNTTRQFYARLGFVQTSDTGAYSQWEWRSEADFKILPAPAATASLPS
jgi:GNAT superfamily N-acetyltransferase